MICTPEIRRVQQPIAAACALILCLFPVAEGLGKGEIDAPLKEAGAALARGDGIAAEVALRRALEHGADRSRIAAQMGEAEMLQGNLPEARHWLAPGQFSADQRAYGYRMLGRLEMDDGNLPAAGRAFDRALQIAPANADLWVDIGRLRYRGGEQLQAIAAVRRAVSLDPENVGGLLFQGQMVRDAVGPVSALPWFARAVQRAPEDTGVLGEYAATLGEVGRAKDMLLVTRRMIELDPRNPQAFYLQAVLAAQVGKNGLARRLMQRTAQAGDNVPAALLLNGILEFRAGNLATATEIFDRLWQRQPDNGSAALLLARTLYQAGEMSELVERFSPSAQRKDASPYLLTLVGRAYEALDERGKAAVFLDRASSVRPPPHMVAIAGPVPVSVLEPHWRADPDAAAQRIPLVRQMLAEGDGARAAGIAEQAAARFSGSADAQILAGDAQMMNGAYAVALRYYQQAALVRLSRPLLARMTVAYVQTGRIAQAEALIARYLNEHPMDGRVAGWGADFAAHRGDWNQFQALAARAEAQGMVADDPAMLAHYAVAALHRGDHEAAKRDALSAYRLQRSNGEVALVLAKVSASEDAGNRVARALMAKVGKIDQNLP